MLGGWGEAPENPGCGYGERDGVCLIPKVMTRDGADDACLQLNGFQNQSEKVMVQTNNCSSHHFYRM